MKRKLIIALAIALILVPALSQAAQFSILGPRALGMGGASVAAVNDSTAVYWNPAALADFKKLEIRVPAGFAARDHMDLIDTWDRINEIYDLAFGGDSTAIVELIQLLNDLNKPNTGADIDTHVGLLVSIPFERSAIAFSTLWLTYGGIYPTVDTANLDPTPAAGPPFVGFNTTALTGIGISNIEPSFSFATSLGEKLFLGANAKMIYANTFVHSENIQTAGDFDAFKSALDASKNQHDEASLDAGILFKLTKNFRLGVVGRYLNSPSFPFYGQVAEKQPAGDVQLNNRSGIIEFEPQYRAGVAWHLLSFLTLSADYDISKNKTLVPGFEDQTFAVGGEITLPAEVFSFRGGLYKNTADSDANLVYTAGIGVRIFMFRADIAGAYDFQEQEAQVSADLVFRF